MPDAIARLEAEIEERRRREAAEAAERAARANDGDEDDEPAPQPQGVSFATRAYPLLEMLRAAQRTKADVMWGV